MRFSRVLGCFRGFFYRFCFLMGIGVFCGDLGSLLCHILFLEFTENFEDNPGGMPNVILFSLPFLVFQTCLAIFLHFWVASVLFLLISHYFSAFGGFNLLLLHLLVDLEVEFFVGYQH